MVMSFLKVSVFFINMERGVIDNKGVEKEKEMRKQIRSE